MKKTILVASLAAFALIAGCSDNKDSGSTKSGNMGVVSDTHKDSCAKGSCSEKGSCCSGKSETKQN